MQNLKNRAGSSGYKSNRTTTLDKPSRRNKRSSTHFHLAQAIIKNAVEKAKLSRSERFENYEDAKDFIVSYLNNTIDNAQAKKDVSKLLGRRGRFLLRDIYVSKLSASNDKDFKIGSLNADWKEYILEEKDTGELDLIAEDQDQPSSLELKELLGEINIIAQRVEDFKAQNELRKQRIKRLNTRAEKRELKLKEVAEHE